MAAKRDLASITEPDDEDQSAPTTSIKRARNANHPQRKKAVPHTRQQQQQQQQQQEPATDITYGQRCCFPGLHGPAAIIDEDLDLEDDTDALAYLRSVRQQASGIPHLLVAPRSGPQLPKTRAADEPEDPASGADGPADRSIYSNGYGDSRGYYADGAYTAAPDDTFSDPKGHGDDDYDDDARNETQNDRADETARVDTAYLASLASRFLALRALLRRTPPPRALAALPPDQSPHVGRFGRDSHTFAIWSARLRHADPHPAQVAAMDKGAVLRVLRVLLGGKFLRAGVELRERTSRWLWALLARLPDGGEMDHTEVGHVRELGKRAALLMHTLREMALLREEVELGVHDEGADAEAWAGGGEDEDEDMGEGEQGEDEDQGQEQPPPPQALSDDRDTEDGEIADEPPVVATTGPEEEEEEEEEDIESAKTRLLASLDVSVSSRRASSSSSSSSELEPTTATLTQQGEEMASTDPARARMNMRATLNMILTVAGEFYGQRDLLEFRDPFHGI